MQVPNLIICFCLVGLGGKASCPPALTLNWGQDLGVEDWLAREFESKMVQTKARGWEGDQFGSFSPFWSFVGFE